MNVEPSRLRFDDRGLIPVVVQDVGSGAVLMLAYADRAAVERTLATGQAHFWSRSRQAPWRKGETSGNTLEVVEAAADCDGDALLLRARPAGPTCHTGARGCFEPTPPRLELGWLAAVLASRRGAEPAASYTARLLAAGRERVAQKVGEEAVEAVVAAVAGRADQLVAESADLLYHLLALLLACGVEPQQVADELVRRHFDGRREGEPGTLPPVAEGKPGAPTPVAEGEPNTPQSIADRGPGTPPSLAEGEP
jgi:phosphoribosyl-ATP pyrophosphohydrolase/phosphoribosyl-AMP cyclohydrolase